MVKDAAREIGRDVAMGAPSAAVTVGGLVFGLTLQEWVYVLTILYTLVLLFKQIPRIYGCAVCFIRNKTCSRTCRD